jgi:hypothetical protein
MEEACILSRTMALRRTLLSRRRAIRALCTCFSVALLTALAPSLTRADDGRLVIERLDVVRGLVVATCRLDEAFDPGTRASIEKGLPVTVHFTVDLWRDRRNWMDKQIDSRVRSFRVRFHPGERVFSVVENERADRRLTFETLEQALAEASNRVLPVHPRWELKDGDRYFVAVEAAIQPLTWSEFQELDGWLSGRIRGGAEPSPPVEGVPGDEGPAAQEGPGISRTLFDFLVDLSGFGDRYFRSRTPTFRPKDLPGLNP